MSIVTTSSRSTRRASIVVAREGVPMQVLADHEHGAVEVGAVAVGRRHGRERPSGRHGDDPCAAEP